MWEEWETERGFALDAFARLVGEGHPPRRAAACLGVSVPAIRALSATFQQQGV